MVKLKKKRPPIGKQKKLQGLKKISIDDTKIVKGLKIINAI